VDQAGFIEGSMSDVQAECVILDHGGRFTDMSIEFEWTDNAAAGSQAVEG